MTINASSPPTTLSNTPQPDIKPIIPRPTSTPPTASSPTTPAPATAPLSLTSKQWIIPPRPKPGRKPATDTPPTKRKAQNRAAQRAFRERRAARVGELEEQLKQIEDENELEQDGLKDMVDKLEKEVEKYRTGLATWVEKCRQLEGELAGFKNTTTSVLKTSKTSVARDDQEPVADDASIGCGNCTLDTRCRCIDDAFAAMGGVPSSTSTSHQHHEKRPHSPVHVNGMEKRIKVESGESLEIDFTAIYASKSAVSGRAPDQSPTSAVADPCGFCSDGTPCICAEVAAEQEQEQQQAQCNSSTGAVSIISRAPGPRQLDQFTPPPSEGDVSVATPNLAGAVAPSACGPSGPGTCAQCRADPNSTLFCKSLAASRAQSSAPPSGCCGGQTPSGSCCQSQSTNAVPLPARTFQRATRSRAALNLVPPPTQKASSGVTLSCADAYTTLSRHPAYERATGDIGEWMPKLHACEPALEGVQGRPALEIDAANVMAVLKDFDRRFGKS